MTDTEEMTKRRNPMQNEDKPVIICIEDGTLGRWKIPPGVRVEVRDYDCAGCPKPKGHYHAIRIGYW